MTDYASFAKVSGQISRLLVHSLDFFCSGEACQDPTLQSASSFTARRGCHVAIERKSGQLAAVSQVVAVRVWPASSYTR